MTELPRPSVDVQRVLARDDLIMLAVDADMAVGIVRQREALARKSAAEKSLFSVALEHHLRAACDGGDEWSIRALAWRHAGVIVRFSALVGIPVTMPTGVSYTTTQMHTNSLRQLEDEATADDPDALPLDLPLYTMHRYRVSRDLRLTGDTHAALASVGNDALNGTGAEPLMGHLMYEMGAAYIATGRAQAVEAALQDKDAYFSGPRASGFSTRYRCNFIRAMSWWETGDDRAGDELREALRLARRNDPARAADADEAPEAGISLLSITLAAAEYLAGPDRSAEEHAEALGLCRQALHIAEHARGRWRVIARSRAPLAVVFQRIYGDIALLAARLPGAEAAEVGLRVALAAKQTGFAAQLRTGDHQLLSPGVRNIIQDIIQVESDHRTRLVSTAETDEKLLRLRFELQEAVSPMLADTVLPPPVDLSVLTKMIGPRYALDYLELPDSLATTHLFRSLVRPGNRLTFERFDPDPFHARFFEYARRHGALARMLYDVQRHRELAKDITHDVEYSEAVGPPGAFDWRHLADDILPEDLRLDLVADRRKPLELVISAHSWLSLVPWPALRLVSTDGTRMRVVENAVVTQTPSLTCLQHGSPPPVSGRALIRLVGGDGGVDIRAERGAWGLPETTDSVPLSACDIGSAELPTAISRLEDSLGRWGFVHFAAHGDGTGLTQNLLFPEAHLSFGNALTLRWPSSILMASCHVGQVINVTEAEPLNLVMGLLSGGARCVVAGIAAVDDQGTGEAASRIVRAIRERSVSLDVALRDAQLAAVKAGAQEREWALLAAYTQ
ncbi:CHAT domain-containing protein [Dactylosporangium siamense]|uniref:CHAT domain-containing protein n=1 Tax=Dactylosporangium siamense TaxID=685454 RepID=A0A919UGT7_9ACTN|nr:CHAT domain-containing protein [Dactylosporangium siamense]GIG50023.1 hypothetical protein Dsi01nite_080640 [Dactylosporangium siamense]